LEIEFRKQDRECTTVLKNHFEQNDREDINMANKVIKRLERHLTRLELKVKVQEETIEALEGVVENQQVVMARFRSCECAKGRTFG